MKTDVTFLGLIRRVQGSKVFVEISPDTPSASPIIHGRVYRLGQVGSFIRIPLGFLNLYGVVSMVGASDTQQSAETPLSPHGQRWVEVQLVGESYGREGFQRGVSVFPTIDDEAHVVTEDDLGVIYSTSSASMVTMGTYATSGGLEARIDLDKLVTRHAAIVGSTGTGKSNSVTALLKALTSGGFPSARVVVIDPHGEYASALGKEARVFSIGDNRNPLVVPYWALSFDELAWFLVDRRSASESLQDAFMRDKILEEKQAQCSNLKAGNIASGDITVDSPVPFSIRDLWYYFDRREKATYHDMPRTSEALVAEGDAATLVSARFQAPGAGSSPPFKPTQPMVMGTYLNKIVSKLRNRDFDFLLSPGQYDGRCQDLNDLMKDWVDHDRSVTVLDLGGVPFEVVDLVVGVVTRILFEGMFWGRDFPGTGKKRPLLMVFEEAHAYLPRGGSAQFVAGYASRSVRRVFKEGRKYGIGGIVVTQRPSELDETILSQCGTFMALRLGNTEDQGRVRAALPDTLAGIVDLLPALRNGEAIVVGEAMAIPSRIRVPLIPRPKSDDAEVAQQWKDPRVPGVQYERIVTGWRQQRHIPASKEGGNGIGDDTRAIE